eukprot:scaffold14713_cov131-Isochrysis_galbana.AAC.3
MKPGGKWGYASGVFFGGHTEIERVYKHPLGSSLGEMGLTTDQRLASWIPHLGRRTRGRQIPIPYRGHGGHTEIERVYKRPAAAGFVTCQVGDGDGRGGVGQEAGWVAVVPGRQGPGARRGCPGTGIPSRDQTGMDSCVLKLTARVRRQRERMPRESANRKSYAQPVDPHSLAAIRCPHWRPSRPSPSRCIDGRRRRA